MGFDLPPERVRRGSAAPMIAVVVGAVVIVGAALLASATTPTTPASPEGSSVLAVATDAVDTGIAAPPASPRAEQGARPAANDRPIPPVTATECHDLDLLRCRAIVLAAVRRVPADAPPVVGVAAWSSLLCDDARDCPASRLDGHRPLGSAVVDFGAGRGSAWFNVAAPERCRDWTCRPVAWLIRWGT